MLWILTFIALTALNYIFYMLGYNAGLDKRIDIKKERQRRHQ